MKESFNDNVECLVPKSMSGTRCSANADAVKSLVMGYSNIINALQTISNNQHQKPASRTEANNLREAMQTLEIGIMSEIWHDVLQPFNKCSKRLQSSDIDLCTAVSLMKSLQTVLDVMRDNFDTFEAKGIARTGNQDYKLSLRRKRQKTCDDATAHTFSPKEAYRINTYVTIIDKLQHALMHRIAAYTDINNIFSFLANVSVSDNMSLSEPEVSENINRLCKAYPEDFTADFTA